MNDKIEVLDNEKSNKKKGALKNFKSHWYLNLFHFFLIMYNTV